MLLQSRSLSRTGEDPAFFVLSAPETCWVEAKNRAGVSQIYDACDAGDVNEMALWLDATPAQAYFLQEHDYISGQHIEITYKNSGKGEMVFTWMRAGKRMTLGILLHPDRMDALDWQDLRGIGPTLAQRIVLDRQENGDFNVVDNIIRVPGVGRKTLESIQPWFVPL
ncbi:MAG: helix-hairpin-helix domain-containing protein [Desulfuromonas sp.]